MSQNSPSSDDSLSPGEIRTPKSLSNNLPTIIDCMSRLEELEKKVDAQNQCIFSKFEYMLISISSIQMDVASMNRKIDDFSSKIDSKFDMLINFFQKNLVPPQ